MTVNIDSVDDDVHVDADDIAANNTTSAMLSSTL